MPQILQWLSFCVLKARRIGSKETPMRLRIHPECYEVHGLSFETPAALEGFLKAYGAAYVHVLPSRDSSYEQVAVAMAAIQVSGAKLFGLVGNERK
jgi:hypothetical protein